MLTFYLIAGGLAVLSAIVLVRPLIAGRGEADNRDARDAQVFRDQLSEIERDLARGTITAGEAEGARVEVSRRLIAASGRARRATAAGPAPQGHSGLAAGLALIGTPALAAALYLGLGAPGVPDEPLSERSGARLVLAGNPDRPGQEAAERAFAAEAPAKQATDPQHAALVDKLRKIVAARPEDVEGHRLLARSLMQLGQYGEGWRSYDDVIRLMDGAAGPEIHAAKAEGMILAAGGYVSPEAATEIATALSHDPSLPVARYYGGLALRQSGHVDQALAMWEALRRDSAPDAPYLKWLDAMIGETVQARSGQPGPSQTDIAAARKLSPQQRAKMIEGMVSRLDEKLTKEGGSGAEWARLVSSYAVLGRMDEAKKAYARALVALGDGPEAAPVKAAAARSGVVDAGTASAPGAQAAAPQAAPQTTVPAAAQAPSQAPQVPGPTTADVAAARQMSPEDRMAMIEGMVSRLESRLTGAGGTAEEWLRLIRSYVQLGRPDDAARVYRLADAALKGDPQAGFVKEQALLMGVPVQ